MRASIRTSEGSPLDAGTPHPGAILKIMQTKIQSKYSNVMFVEDQIQHLVEDMRNCLGEVHKLTRNLCDDLRGMKLSNYAQYFQEIRGTLDYFTGFMCDKSIYLKSNCTTQRRKDGLVTQQRGYCPICSKQVKEVKIQQIHNSLSCNNTLTDAGIGPEQEEQEDWEQARRVTELDYLMQQISSNMGRLRGLNNQKTISSLQQFLSGTNDAIQMFFKDKSNYQTFNDNRDVVAILFKQFINKFLEVSQNDIKPTILKYAKDLADYLFRSRNRDSLCTNKATQTIAPYSLMKSSLRRIDSAKSLKKEDKQVRVESRNAQNMIIQQQNKIEVLKKKNLNLQQKVRSLNQTLKVLKKDLCTQDGGEDVLSGSETDRHQEFNSASHKTSAKHKVRKVGFEKYPGTVQKIRLNDLKQFTLIRGIVKTSENDAAQVLVDQDKSTTNIKSFSSYSSHHSNSDQVSQSQLNDYTCQQFQPEQPEQRSEVRKTNMETQFGGQAVDFQTQTQSLQMVSPNEVLQVPTKDKCRQCSAVQVEGPNGTTWGGQGSMNPNGACKSTQITSEPKQYPIRETEEQSDNYQGSNVEGISSFYMSQKQKADTQTQSLDKKQRLPGKPTRPGNQRASITANMDQVTDLSGNKAKSSKQYVTNDCAQSDWASRKSIQLRRFSKQKVQRGVQRERLSEKQGKTLDQQQVRRGSTVQLQPRMLSSFGKRTQGEWTPGKFGRLSIEETGKFNPTESVGKHNVKRQGLQRTKTLIMERGNEYQASSLGPNQRVLTETKNSKQLHHYFSQQDLVGLFGSLEAAYNYEMSPHKKTPLIGKFKKKQQQLISRIYNHLQHVKIYQNQLYHKIKSFVKFPYQSVVNKFEGPTMQSNISLSSFSNVLALVLNAHSGCINRPNKCYCQHFQRLMDKFLYSEGLVKSESLNLPNLRTASNKKPEDI